VSVRLRAVGDVLLWTRNGKKPFDLIQHELQQKDLLFGNLETVLSESGDPSRNAGSTRTLRRRGYISKTPDSTS